MTERYRAGAATTAGGSWIEGVVLDTETGEIFPLTSSLLANETANALNMGMQFPLLQPGEGLTFVALIPVEFLGGPWDGKRMEVDPVVPGIRLPDHEVLVSGGDDHRTHIYQLTLTVGEPGTWTYRYKGSRIG